MPKSQLFRRILYEAITIDSIWPTHSDAGRCVKGLGGVYDLGVVVADMLIAVTVDVTNCASVSRKRFPKVAISKCAAPQGSATAHVAWLAITCLC